MGKDLYDTSPTYRSVFDRGVAALAPYGVNLHQLVFEGPADQLTRTLHAQPALLVSNIALLEHLRVEEGIEPAPNDLMAGHSLGEWAAYVAAGALTPEEGAVAVYWRGRYMEEAFPYDSSQPRPMAAVLGFAPKIVEEVCRTVSREGHVVIPANFNAPGQIVISGHPAAVQEASSQLRQGGGRVVELPVAAPFHSPLMQPVKDLLAAKIAELGITVRRPGHRVLSNCTGREIDFDADHIASLLNQITGAVHWEAEMVRAWELGAIQLVSVDISGDVLLGLAARIFSGSVPVQSVDPKIPMHCHALRAAPGVIRTTVFPPPARTAIERLLEFSYDAGAIAREIRRLLATGEEDDLKTALLVMDNPYNSSREAGLRVLQAWCEKPDTEVLPERKAQILAALTERGLEWPAPEVRDLPTQPLPPDQEGKLRGEIFQALVQLQLAPIDDEDLVYYVASRWEGDSDKLQTIMKRLGQITRYVLPKFRAQAGVRLKKMEFGPEEERIEGIDSWEKLVLYLDYSEGIKFTSPGATKMDEMA